MSDTHVALLSTDPVGSAKNAGDFDVAVYYDGDCPLCMREIRMLSRLDRRKRIRFLDIASPTFDAQAEGIPWQTLMDKIHGRLPDGSIVQGVEVFRRLYAAVGFGAVVAITRLPGIRHLLDFAYSVFAKNRLRLTGRCESGACEVRPRGGL
jgi:predicted DCC family thiol-disulfide oxidoreductase YuxK